MLRPHIVKRFALIPTIVDGEWVWFRHYYVVRMPLEEPPFTEYFDFSYRLTQLDAVKDLSPILRIPL